METGRIRSFRAYEAELAGRDFFEIGDDYQIVVATAGRMINAAEGKLVAIYSSSETQLAEALELETARSNGRYRAYFPLGPGVHVRRLAKEPDSEPETLEQLEAAHDGVGVAARFVLGHAAMRDHVHGKSGEPDTYAHAHVMLDAEHEDHENPAHWHDEKDALSPIYGPRPDSEPIAVVVGGPIDPLEYRDEAALTVDLGPASVRLHDHIAADPNTAYQHEHVMLDSESRDEPLHAHDERRYGPLSPVYGARP